MNTFLKEYFGNVLKPHKKAWIDLEIPLNYSCDFQRLGRHGLK